MILDVATLGKQYAHADGPVDALIDVELDDPEGRVRHDHGAIRLGQVHAAPVARRAHPSDVGRDVLPRDGRCTRWTSRELAAFRRDHVGFVMQNFSLVPYLTRSRTS